MKKVRGLLVFSLAVVAAVCNAQDTPVNNTSPNSQAVSRSIQDKVFEFGVPMLFIILLLSILVTVLKNRSDHRLKMKMVEKGVSDEALVRIFKDSNAVLKLEALKYFLVCGSIGIAFLVVHFTDEQKDYLLNQAGFFALGIILLFISLAFYIYYRILNKKL